MITYRDVGLIAFKNASRFINQLGATGNHLLQPIHQFSVGQQSRIIPVAGKLEGFIDMPDCCAFKLYTSLTHYSDLGSKVAQVIVFDAG